jgi:hypothetical protein
MSSVEAEVAGPARPPGFLGGRGLTVAGAAAAAAMLGAAFFAITASDIRATYAETVWHVLPALFGLVAFGLSWAYAGEGFSVWRAALREAAHWLGVYGAIRAAFYLVATDHFTESNAGLAAALLLALGAFLSGVHGQWRMAPVGLALLCATAVVALIEENMWILVGIAALGVGAVALAGVAQARLRGGGAPGG